MKRCLSGLIALALAGPSTAGAAVVAAEYFLDHDPGQGNGTLVQLSAPTETASLVIQIPPAVIGALPEGPHLLACRVQDAVGNWSIAFARSFFKEGAAVEDRTPPTWAINAIFPNPRNTALESMTLVFSEPVNGLELADLGLSRNGSANLLTAAQTLNTTDLTTFTLGGLGEVTGPEGHYELRLSAAGSGVMDRSGNGLAIGTTGSWTTDLTAPTATIAEVAPKLRNTPVENLTLTFSEPVAGLDLGDLTLSRNGGENLLTANQTLTLEGGLHAVLGGLSALTAEEGDYTLRLITAQSDLRDAAGNQITAEATTSWRTDTTPPSTSIAKVAPNPRNSAITTLRIVFSEPVQGFDVADLTLSRSGGANLMPGPVTLETLDQTTFSVAGLADLTGPEGSYVLRLSTTGSGIADAAGNLLTGTAAESWDVDRTEPTVRIVAVAPDPQNDAVGSLTLVFSEFVTGFSVADLLLTRDGGTNLLTGAEALSTTDNLTFQLSGLDHLTGPEGRYEFRLVADGAGIADVAGNLLNAGATTGWSTDRTPPAAQIAAVNPNPRNGAVSELHITFSEPVSGLDLTDLVLTRDGGGNLLGGSTALGTTDNLTFTLSGLATATAADGAYSLTLRASNSGIVDSAGNLLVTDAEARWAVDTTPPTVSITMITPDPRTNAVDRIEIVFSEMVTGFNPHNLKLSRDDGFDLLSPAQTLVSTDNRVFTVVGLSNLTTATGTYHLLLSSTATEIVDAAGNRLLAGATETWTTVPAPTPVAEYFIDTDPGPGNGVPVTAVAAGWPRSLVVDVPPTLIVNLAAGNHMLACRVRDDLGNWSIAFARPFHKEDTAPEPPAMVAAIEFQWFLDNAAVGEPVVIPTRFPARELTLAPVASLIGLENGRTYQLVVTPVDTRGQRGIGFTRAVLVDRQTEPTKLVLSGLRTLADGTVQWTFSGEPGRIYSVQTSTNLTDWTDLKSIRLEMDTMELTDADNQSAVRFYRTLAQ